MVKVSEDAPARADARGLASRAPARREPAAFRAFVTLLAFIPPAREPDPMNGALNVANPHLASPARAVHHRRAPSPDGQEAQHPQHVRHRARRSRTFPARAEPSPDDRFTGKAIRRNARRVWLVVSGGGRTRAGARGSPAVMSVERRPPRIRASARPSPRIAIRAYTRARPTPRYSPAPPPADRRRCFLPIERAPESARRDNTSQFYYPLSAATTE